MLKSNSGARYLLWSLFNAHSVSVPNVQQQDVRALRVFGEPLVELPGGHDALLGPLGVRDGAPPESVVESDGSARPDQLQSFLVVDPVTFLQS